MGIRIFSLNLFIRPPLIRNNESDYKSIRLEYFIQNILPAYDIICLQEIFAYGSSRRSQLFQAAQSQGFAYCIGSSTKSLICNGCIDGGLLILSKFPFIETQEILYPRGIISDR
jgi:Endonuclease/Exonuclease/phosphatase family